MNVMTSFAGTKEMLKSLVSKGIGMTVAAAALSITPGLTPIADAASSYGAIAYSASTGEYGSAVAWNRKAAELGALFECQRRSAARDCEVKVWFRDAWGSLAVASNGAYGTGWGYNQSNPQSGRYIAERYALQVCRNYGGVGCRVIFSRPAIGYGY
jgi:hypothetical protein